MKSRISELMDCELERDEADRILEALRSEGAARETWRTYHLIGDVMRDTRTLSAGFAARVAVRLAEEPTVMAPQAAPRRPARAPSWWALSAAASVAAVALVGWVAFGTQDQDRAGPAPQSARLPEPNPPAATAAQVVQVAPPDTASDYLYAHQGYSPRNSLQGMAPYVRTVSGEARVARQ